MGHECLPQPCPPWPALLLRHSWLRLRRGHGSLRSHGCHDVQVRLNYLQLGFSDSWKNVIKTRILGFLRESLFPPGRVFGRDVLPCTTFSVIYNTFLSVHIESYMAHRPSNLSKSQT